MNGLSRFADDCDPRAINDLCRHEMLVRLYSDILTDMTVCRLEGWDVKEFPRIIRDRMDAIVEGRP